MKKRLNHLFICSGYPPVRGFFSHRPIVRMQDFLCTKVISVRAASPGRMSRREYSIDGIEVLEIPFPVVPNFNKNLALVRIGAQMTFPFAKKLLQCADLVESVSLYTAGEVARVWLGKLGDETIARVSDAIGDDVKVDLPRLSENERRAIIGSYDAILSNSKDISANIRAMVPDGCPPVYEAYRGVDFGEFNPGVRPSGPFVGGSSPRFLYLGGFPRSIEREGARDVKGGAFLLEAWRLFEKSSPVGSLMLGGPGSDADYLGKWRQSLSSPERVAMIGRLSPEDVPGFIRGADVVVIPSLSEGIPNLANEAQACGVPVLATDVGGTAESVEDGVTGFLVERGSADSLHRGMERFRSMSGESFETMGTRGAERMRATFPWENYVETSKKAFRISLSKRGRIVEF